MGGANLLEIRDKIMIELEKKETLEGIWIGDMKDGDVAVIVSWAFGNYAGRIVQRCGLDLIPLGMDCSKGWSGLWHNPASVFKNNRVRLLEKGEKLVVA